MHSSGLVKHLTNGYCKSLLRKPMLESVCASTQKTCEVISKRARTMIVRPISDSLCSQERRIYICREAISAGCHLLGFFQHRAQATWCLGNFHNQDGENAGFIGQSHRRNKLSNTRLPASVNAGRPPMGVNQFLQSLPLNSFVDAFFL